MFNHNNRKYPNPLIKTKGQRPNKNDLTSLKFFVGILFNLLHLI